MKRRRWFSWSSVLIGLATLVLAVLPSLLADLIRERLEHAPGYVWLLTFAPILGLGLTGAFSLISDVRLSRLRRRPPPVWTVADRAWTEALADRETVPSGTKELSW